MGKAFDALLSGMIEGRSSDLMGDTDRVRELLWRVYDERCHKAEHHRSQYQVRSNLQKKEDAASYAGFITAENPTSGPYQGTSFVWMPGREGSIAILVIGTDGFGADTHILGRPGHARRLRALTRLHRGKLWVKPDLLDLSSAVPEPVTERWPDGLDAVKKAYDKVIYAAVPVRAPGDAEAVQDLLDLFFSEHGTPLTGAARERWSERHSAMLGAIFPRVELAHVLELLQERRFLILEGPPGTGKTRMAYRGSACHAALPVGLPGFGLRADRILRRTHARGLAARTRLGEGGPALAAGGTRPEAARGGVATATSRLHRDRGGARQSTGSDRLAGLGHASRSHRTLGAVSMCVS